MAFKNTRWTLIALAREPAGDDSREALEQICRDYWAPLYAFVRHKGYSPEDAADAVQEFFYRIIHKNLLSGLDPARGRFRDFLRVALTNFLINEYMRSRTRRRSPGCPIVPIDYALAEKWYSSEPASSLTADKLFDREWALLMMRRSVDTLETGYAEQGRADRFEALKPYITVESERLPYDEIASQLGVTRGAVKVAIHRLRRQYRESLRARIRETLDEPSNEKDVDAELRELMAALTV